MSRMVERVAMAIERQRYVDPLCTAEAVARAAIEAMREPTKEMLMSGVMANAGPRSSIHGYIYSAMIDAALRED